MTAAGETVAMAVLFGMKEGEENLLPGAQIALNRVGKAEYDCIYPEYNGLLCAPELRLPALRRLLCAMADAQCERLELGGLDASDSEVEAPPGWSVRRYVEQGYYHVNLKKLRTAGLDYASTLSRNSRQQIRRSIREIEDRAGPITLNSANNVNDALRIFDRMADLHQKHWLNRGEAGAFSEPFFRTFHEKLITTSFDTGVLELISVNAGEQEIGRLYNFCYGDRVYSYQSGFVEPRSKHDRPGLVSHVLNIERHLREGGNVYDFLAGDHRYKSSLAELAGLMVWIEANRNSMKYRLTNVLRNVKSWSVESLK